jgi:hypothetical protein
MHANDRCSRLYHVSYNCDCTTPHCHCCCCCSCCCCEFYVAVSHTDGLSIDHSALQRSNMLPLQSLSHQHSLLKLSIYAAAAVLLFSHCALLAAVSSHTRVSKLMDTYAATETVVVHATAAAVCMHVRHCSKPHQCNTLACISSHTAAVWLAAQLQPHSTLPLLLLLLSLMLPLLRLLLLLPLLLTRNQTVAVSPV